MQLMAYNNGLHCMGCLDCKYTALHVLSCICVTLHGLHCMGCIAWVVLHELHYMGCIAWVAWIACVVMHMCCIAWAAWHELHCMGCIAWVALHGLHCTLFAWVAWIANILHCMCCHCIILLHYFEFTLSLLNRILHPSGHTL